MFLTLFYVGNFYCQLQTSNTLTPQQLVNNVLIGNGINVTNIQYTGSNSAIGFFNGVNCNLGLDSGIVLTTGTIFAPDGPQGPNNDGGSGIDNNEPGELLLEQIAGNTSFNAAKLEFDFIPQNDSIKFNFVFASEEYIEFVNSGVNDAFGFFISGPNPSGGMYTNYNIALIPNTTTPITIDNINNITNSSYFIDNGDGFSAPFNSSNTYIQYDGLTVKLPALAAVECGQTYHIIITISDISDGIYDSGVFLEAGSFTSNTVSLSTQINSPGVSLNDSTMIEGCSEGIIWFVRNDSIAFNQEYNLSYSGTAIMGQDFNNLPNSITFPAGEDSVALIISSFDDFINEAIESIIIKITIPTCSSIIEDSIIVYIGDEENIQINLTSDSIFCLNASSEIISSVSGGISPYSFTWNGSSSTDSIITVSPNSSTWYQLTVTDACGNQNQDSIQVVVLNPPPLDVITNNDTILPCDNLSLSLTGTVSGGSGSIQYLWNTGSTSSTITIQAQSTTQYILTVQDECNTTSTDTVNVVISKIPYNVNLPEDMIICKGESITICPHVSGGYGSDFQFLWSDSSTDSCKTNTINQNTSFVLQVADECGVFEESDTITITIKEVNASFFSTGNQEVNLPTRFINQSTGANYYIWSSEGQTSNEENFVYTYTEDGNYLVELIAIDTLLGCTDTFSIMLKINPEFFIYLPNSFTPDGDEFNNVFGPKGTEIKEFEMFIYNRWGEIIFESNDYNSTWDGTYKGNIVKEGTYVYTIRVLNLKDEVIEIKGHVNVLN